MTEPAESRQRRAMRASRLFIAMWALNVVAVVVLDIWWRSAVLGFLIGFCLSWLTVVALFFFQEARGAR